MKTFNDMWICHNNNDDIEVRDDNNPLITTSIIKKEDLDPKMFVIDYGKYKGLNLSEIFDEDPRYIEFLKQSSDDLLLKQCIENI